MPKVPVDFAGPSYFGGKNNELVLCCGKSATYTFPSSLHFCLIENFQLATFTSGIKNLAP